MGFNFDIENAIKQDYLSHKPTATAESDAFILRSVDEYEKMVNKSIYNMTYSEIREMLMMQFNNSSVKTVTKNISILKTYIDFCINQKLVLHGENRLATFTTAEANELVNKQALINKYVPKEKIRSYQKILFNEQDQLLLELIFLGVRGRTTEDGTLEEIINLTINDIDEKNNMIILTQNNGRHRILEIETSTIELIKETYEQKIYVENNGEETNNPRSHKPRESQINKLENFVFRVPGKKKFEKFTPNLLNSRMRRMQKYLDNRYITYTSLYMSGMIYMAMNFYKENGDVTREDFIKICNRYNYGDNDSSRYWFNVKALFEQYKEIMENKNTKHSL